MSHFILEWTFPDTGTRSRVDITNNRTVRIGRLPTNEVVITGDALISREHAEVAIEEDQVVVRCLESARNPLIYNNEESREIRLPSGGSFQIGATEFTCKLVSSSELNVPEFEDDVDPEDPQDGSKQKVRESFYAPDVLSRAEFGNAAQQIEILANLPDLIAKTGTDDELSIQVAELLLKGIPQAEAVAVVRYAGDDLNAALSGASPVPNPSSIRVETRESYSGRFRPSRRLMLKALQLQQSAMHIWEEEGSSLEFTSSDGLGWAFTSPIRGEACHGWCLYVSGKGSRRGNMFVHEETLQGDLRFTELLAQFIGSIRQVRTLQNQRTQLSAFFSPKVIENLTGTRASRAEMAPAERDVTVLFCDLRGFSKRSEALRHDLHALLKSISEALGVMANGVLGRDGAIADFQGDAILGFWGWPIPDANGPWPACQAALAIAEGFRKANEDAHDLLKGLSAGIGVAHGRALAGRIGTEQQAKIGVFGPVVNQGSRLEGMTKQFGVSICIDQTAAAYLRKNVPATEARTRLLARVRPKGMGIPLDVFELLPGETPDSAVSSKWIASHESAVNGVIQGKWPQVREFLKKFPENDGPANFLRAFLAKAPEVPGPDWDGAIQLESK